MLRVPTVVGTIRRRFLLNFRIDAATLNDYLPAPFRPQLVGGWGVGGICLIRLEGIRPKNLPLPESLGIDSENAAHRFAVEWDAGGTVKTGVYIPRRDTDSRLNHLAGGRIFPGVHYLARFDIQKAGDEYAIDVRSEDGDVTVRAHAAPQSTWAAESCFASLAEASAFFEAGSLGYSNTHRPDVYDGLILDARNWAVEAMTARDVHSSFFSDTSIFPEGSVEFDHALFMHDIEHEWRSTDDLCAS